ncbi:hypothetical protein SBA2_40046 [Acidobacteriia bacterium SbA2]|nr:hypothetical protein SBA2_40046 [Acidobacteriia bacterium SbA2]
MEGLSHAVVGDLAKIGEGRFGDDGAEVWVGIEGLEELRGAHGFAERENAAGMSLVLLRVEEVKPLVNVVALEQAVGGERAVARAVGAGVGKKHGESVGEEELSVSGHADAVVAEAVEEEDGVPVGVVGMDGPGAEGDVVGCRDGCVGEVGVEGVGGVAHGRGVVFGEWASRGVERAVGEVDAADGAEGEVEEDGEESVTSATGQGHGLRDCTGMEERRFRGKENL